MKELQELIDTANKLSQGLERMANEEIKFCIDLQLRFEQMSWEIFRAASELNEIKSYI